MDYKKNLPGETMYDKAYTDAASAERKNAAAEEPFTQSAEAERTAGERTTAANTQDANNAARQADGASHAEPKATVYDVPPQARTVADTGRAKEPNLKRQFAIASMVLGISSFLILFVIPLIGIVPAAVGSVFGIVFGIFSHKEFPGFCWSGIILSILTLFLVLVMVILGCIISWNFLLYLVNYAQDGLPNFYRGFYY